jgi:predicted transposase YdaD
VPTQFDAALKELVARHPEGFLQLAGLPVRGPVRVLDADLGTVSGAGDRLLLLRALRYLCQIELQASRDAGIVLRMLLYNVVMLRRHRKPVESIVILLRKQADHPGLTGRYDAELPSGRRLVFEYQVVRLWEVSAAHLLECGLAGTLLAPLGAVEEAALPEVLEQVRRRIIAEPAELRMELWSAVYILMGLRLPRGKVRALLRGLPEMRESSTYRAILAEGMARGREEGMARGREEEARSNLLALGARRLGPPAAAQLRRVESAGALQLEAWLLRLLDVESWDELLSTSGGEQ